MTETMFVEKPKLIEVLETPVIIPNEKVKKPRKPMSEERKEALREQLKVAREIKKNKKEASKPKEPEIILDIGGHSIPEPATKPIKEKKPRQKKVVLERNIEPKIPDDSIELRRQLDELRASHKANENELLKQQIANQKLKNAKKEKMQPIMEEPQGPGFPELPKGPPSPIAPQKRYSTYAKSVWDEYN
jgi:hypothetical protein